MQRRSILATVAAALLLLALTAGTALGARPVWTFSIALEGAQEVAPGDLDAKSRAIVQVRPDAGVACFNIGWMGIDGDVFGGHIHAAPAGSNGGIVVSLFGGPLGPPTDFSGDRGRTMGCVTADSGVLWNIVNDPAGYYVNVHSTEFPGGAVRGQLD